MRFILFYRAQVFFFPIYEIAGCAIYKYMKFSKWVRFHFYENNAKNLRPTGSSQEVT